MSKKLVGRFFEFSVVVSEGMPPDEMALIGSNGGTRWTPDGGVEVLSE